VEVFDFVPKQALEHAGVDFLEPIIESKLQAKNCGDRLSCFDGAPQRTGVDCVD
jgi:hypothetical protein